MSTISALMIGWGLFWLLVWIGLSAVFTFLRGKTEAAQGSPAQAIAQDQDVVLGCWVMAVVAAFWMVAWAAVRSLLA